MTLLRVAQQLLVERTVQVYNDMRDTDLSLHEYKSHYGNMGEFICYIDKFTSFGDICNDIMNGSFSRIMLHGEDEDLEEFIKDVLKHL